VKKTKPKETTKTSGHIELSDSSGDEDVAEETRRARALEDIEEEKASASQSMKSKRLQRKLIDRKTYGDIERSERKLIDRTSKGYGDIRESSSDEDAVAAKERSDGDQQGTVRDQQTVKSR